VLQTGKLVGHPHALPFHTCLPGQGSQRLAATDQTGLARVQAHWSVSGLKTAPPEHGGTRQRRERSDHTWPPGQAHCFRIASKRVPPAQVSLTQARVAEFQR
jgi:hypothetical protein